MLFELGKPDTAMMEVEKISETGTESDKKLLSNSMVYFSLIKGYISSGILFLPLQFVESGPGISLIFTLVSGFLSYYCSILLIESQEKLKARSY
jgi:amino acid permease